MVDIITIANIIFASIGTATVVFRVLEPIVNATKYTWDDNLVKKCLTILTVISKYISLNKDNSKIEIKLKKQ